VLQLQEAHDEGEGRRFGRPKQDLRGDCVVLADPCGFGAGWAEDAELPAGLVLL
jgi:hypothetical protein